MTWVVAFLLLYLTLRALPGWVWALAALWGDMGARVGRPLPRYDSLAPFISRAGLVCQHGS